MNLFILLFPIILFLNPSTLFADEEKLDVEKVGNALRQESVSTIIKNDKETQEQATPDEKIKYLKMMRNAPVKEKTEEK